MLKGDEAAGEVKYSGVRVGLILPTNEQSEEAVKPAV
jgi:hypothetical protein